MAFRIRDGLFLDQLNRLHVMLRSINRLTTTIIASTPGIAEWIASRKKTAQTSTPYVTAHYPGDRVLQACVISTALLMAENRRRNRTAAHVGDSSHYYRRSTVEKVYVSEARHLFAMFTRIIIWCWAMNQPWLASRDYYRAAKRALDVATGCVRRDRDAEVV